MPPATKTPRTTSRPERAPKTRSPRRRADAARTDARAVSERWLLELTAIPTAAGREGRVIAWIERWVRDRSESLTLARDACGNLFVRQKRGPAGRAELLITAHLDHPAFVVRKVDGLVAELEFRGGVQDPYFVGATIEIVDRQDRAHRARITALDATTTPFKTVRARLSRRSDSLVAGDIARWSLPKPRIAKGRLRTHACDDLAAVAAALSALERIRALPDTGHVGLLFTRAEEIGFIGAIGAARASTIAKSARLVCLENSRSFAESPIGAGPIVRVGDRISVFTPELTDRIAAIMTEHQKREPGFRWQRKLMPGGACEATAFASYGFASTCLCLPLGNYHNMAEIDAVLAGKRPARVASEEIAIDDFHGLVSMLEVIATQLDDAKVPPVRDRMEELWRRHAEIVTGEQR